MAFRDKIIKSDEIQDVFSCNRVMAGPGAGKTYWIVRQISYALKLGVLHATDKIACITYTNKAAQNIEERVGDKCNELYVSTIHSFLYAFVIKPYLHLIADSENFAIEKLDGHDDEIIIGYKILSEILPSNKRFAIQKFKDYSKLKSYISKYHWQSNGQDVLLKSVPQNKTPLRVFGKNDVLAYKQYTWNNYGLLHHDDILYFAFKLIVKYPQITNILSNQFPFVFIDEYQDTNSIQHHIFQCLANAGSYVTIIGDEAQSIYRFAGSDIKNLSSFKSNSLQCFRIEDNRRSTPSLVNFFNMLRPELQQKAIVTEDYGVPTILIGSPVETYLKAKELSNNEEITSLSWSNSTANMLKLKLNADKSKDMLASLLDTSSNHDRARFTFYCINAVENAKLRLMKDAIVYVCKAFNLDKRDIMDKQKAFIILLRILERDSEYRNSSLMDFYNIINGLREKSLPKLQKGKDCQLFSNRYLAFAKDVRYNDEESEHLTIHKAKGLEFNNVILIIEKNDEAVNFLMNADLNAKQDDWRLYYVACSRAKRRLFISIPHLDDTQKNLLKEKYKESIIIAEN